MYMMCGGDQTNHLGSVRWGDRWWNGVGVAFLTLEVPCSQESDL